MSMTRYHDLVLLFIPAALLGISGPLAITGVPVSIAVPLGATVAIVIMSHALFIRARHDHSSNEGVPTNPDTSG
jgi:hypothetical protein